MLLDHWGIEQSPFCSGLDVIRFYASPMHEEALARIDFLVSARRRVGLLVGGSGTGKSLTLSAAAKELRRTGKVVALVNVLGIQTREMFWQIADQLGTTPRADDDLGRLWRLLTDRVVENQVQQIETVLLVDDAGEAGPDLLTQFVRLARIDQASGNRWTMVLTVRAGQTTGWNDNLRDLLDLRIDLAPWQETDTIGFVQTALVEAGVMEPVFEDDALSVLHELSGGVPRQVVRLADHSLLAGAAARVESIHAEVVYAACEQIERTSAVVA